MKRVTLTRIILIFYFTYFNTYTVHFCYSILLLTKAQLQLINTLLHVSTLLCHLQGFNLSVVSTVTSLQPG